MRIHDLGTRAEEAVACVMRELEERQILIFPEFYVDEDRTGWGVPTGTSSIAIPEKARKTGRRRMLRYLRHELGHVFFNHHPGLCRTWEFRRHFTGGNGQPEYPEGLFFRFNPLSRSFVYYLSPFYAQKHPQETFAEIFASWLHFGDVRKIARFNPWLNREGRLRLEAGLELIARFAPVKREPVYER